MNICRLNFFTFKPTLIITDRHGVMKGMERQALWLKIDKVYVLCK